MIKINASVSYCHHRILRIRQVCFLIQHFTDTPDTRHGHTDHNNYHGEHHQAHQQRHDITEETRQVTGS